MIAITKDNNHNNKRYNNKDEEFYTYGIPGLGIGTALGIVFDQLTMGIAIGTSLGVLFSALFKNKKDKNNKN